MTKRFTDIEHDYENAWIKCNDDGDFMIYAIYKELDESLPSLEDLLNGLNDENQELKTENKELKKEKCTFDELNYYKQKSASLETALLKEQRINLKLKSINENIKKYLNEENGGL